MQWPEVDWQGLVNSVGGREPQRSRRRGDGCGQFAGWIYQDPSCWEVASSQLDPAIVGGPEADARLFFSTLLLHPHPSAYFLPFI